MALQPVPILGLSGWIFTPGEKMDNLFMHYVESNYSQAVGAYGQVFSFQYLLAMYGDKPTALADEIKKSLSTYFGGYYTSVECSVDTIVDPTKGGALILRIFLVAKDDIGKTYNLAKESSNINGKTIRWANYNNYGDPNMFAA